MEITDIAINKKDFEKYSICEIVKEPTYCIPPSLEKFIKAMVADAKEKPQKMGWLKCL